MTDTIRGRERDRRK